MDPYANEFIGSANGAAVLGTIPGSQSVGPDDFGYSELAVAPSFIDITGTGTAVLQGTDDDTYFLDTSALGFSFDFYGQHLHQPEHRHERPDHPERHGRLLSKNPDLSSFPQTRQSRFTGTISIPFCRWRGAAGSRGRN